MIWIGLYYTDIFNFVIVIILIDKGMGNFYNLNPIINTVGLQYIDLKYCNCVNIINYIKYLFVSVMNVG